MRILYLDPIVHTHVSANYKYYDGVFDSLDDVFLYKSPPEDGVDMQVLIDNLDFAPDVVVFGLGWFNHKFYGEIKNINLPSVCILFKPQNDLKQKLSFCKINKIDLILTPTPIFSIYEEMAGVKSKLFPYGFDEKVFFDRKLTKEYDVGFSGALHENKYYPPKAFPVKNIRTKIGNLLKQNSKIKVFWSASDSRPARIPSYEDYSKTINSSKIWIATQAAFGDLTPRYYEIAASGALLFCQKIPNEYTHIFKSGYNCVEFQNDLSDFDNKLDFYLNNDQERERIINNAKLFFEKFQWSSRAKDLISIINGVINENE